MEAIGRYEPAVTEGPPAKAGPLGSRRLRGLHPQLRAAALALTYQRPPRYRLAGRCVHKNMRPLCSCPQRDSLSSTVNMPYDLTRPSQRMAANFYSVSFDRLRSYRLLLQ